MNYFSCLIVCKRWRKTFHAPSWHPRRLYVSIIFTSFHEVSWYYQNFGTPKILWSMFVSVFICVSMVFLPEDKSIYIIYIYTFLIRRQVRNPLGRNGFRDRLVSRCVPRYFLRTYIFSFQRLMKCHHS